MKPLVSIIIPVFNAEKYLSATIFSAINQTWANKEIIIVDDGSTDNSLLIAKKFENEWIKVFTQQNKGAGSARNKALSESKGDFIQFLDADDLLSCDKISSQVEILLQHPNKLAVCSTIHFFDNQNLNESTTSAYEDSFLFDTDNPADFIINLYGGAQDRGSMVQTNAWLTPIEIIKKAGYWSEFYSPDDDGEFFCRALLAGSGVVYTRDCFNYYRKHTHHINLSAVKTKKSLQGRFQSFLLKKEHLLKATDNTIAKKALAHSAMDLAVAAFTVDRILANQIFNVIKEIGGTNYIPVLGGPKLEMIKKTIGWKTTLSLRNFYHKLLNN